MSTGQQHPAILADELLNRVYTNRNGNGLWDAAAVYRDLDEVKRLCGLIDPVAEPPKPGLDKPTLEWRWVYNMGLVPREVYEPDHFLKAAAMHDKAATMTAAPDKRAIEVMMATCERMHHAVEVNDRAFFLQSAAALATAEAELKAIVLAEKNEGSAANQKLVCDIPAHRAYCYLLMGLDYEQWGQDRSALRTPPPAFAEIYAVWDWIIAGLCAQTADGKLAAALRVMSEGPNHPTYTVFAYYLMAEAMGLRGNAKARKVRLEAAVNHPTHSGHFVRAVARRELTKLAELAKSAT